MNIKNIRNAVSVLALALLGLASCTSDVTTTQVGSETTEQGSRKVTFAVSTGSNVSTRATAGSTGTVTSLARENTIKEMVVAVFRPDPANSLKPLTFTESHVVTPTLDDGSTDTYTFQYEMDKAGLFYMYLIANPGSALKAHLTATTPTTGDLTPETSTVTDFFNLVEENNDPMNNAVADGDKGNLAQYFLMTSKPIQVDIDGRNATDMTASVIEMTRAASRIDIDASALDDFVINSVDFYNRNSKSVLIANGTPAVSVADASNPVTYTKPTGATLTALPVAEQANISDKVWKAGIYAYENHTKAATVDGAGVTKLVIHATYQGVNVDQTVEFWDREASSGTNYNTIELSRNTLYYVTLKKKDVPTEYAPLEATVSVANWREGEAILWSGANLAQKAEPEIVKITKSVTDDGGTTYDTPTTVNATVISTNAFKSSVGNRQMKLTIKVKTGATGANIECENLTAALGTIESPSSPTLTYDDDGNLYQEWTVNLNASAAKTAKDNSKPLVFKIYNQLDSEKQITLQLNPGIDPDDLQYGDIIYDDCTIVHLGEAKPASGNAIGVVAYKSDTPTNICEAGIVNMEGETVIGKVLVVALQDVSNSGLTWGSDSEGNHNDALFPNLLNNLSLHQTDMKGYEKTKQMATKSGECASHTHNAATKAWNYHTESLSSCSEDYLSGSTGWFFPSAGQFAKIAEGFDHGGDKDGNNKGTETFNVLQYAFCSKFQANSNSIIVTWAGGTAFSTSFHTSSEIDGGHIIRGYIDGGGINYDSDGNHDDVKSSTYSVRAILAY